MRINQIQSKFYSYNSTDNHQLNFSANPNSPLLKFKNEDFFVNIKGYGKNKDWASIIKKTADKAANLILSGKTSDKVLQEIAKGAKNANGFCRDYRKRQHTGILRTERRGYGKTGTWKDIELVTPISKQYEAYETKLVTLENKPVKSPYNDIKVAGIERGNWIDYDLRIVHPDGAYVSNALDRVGGKYFNLKKDFISKPENVTTKTLPEINENIAEIRWLMAHSMPWERGSDAISNVFIRSLYKSMGIKSYPLKKDISLDLEAFCTPLSEYKKNFASYFEKAPHIVE